jgi:hypothetical protein
MVKIAVILPSRGLMFSQTADEILQNLKGIEHKFFFAHGKPIPDCFEEPTNRALADETITHLWFVEDDMILSPDALRNMINVEKAVVTVDYPTTDYGGGAVFKIKGQVIFGGTGCTLVMREVFDELKKPYFRTDICWNIKNFGDFIKIIAVPRGEDNSGYGLHDVNFFMNLYRLEIPVHDAGFTVGQRKLKALGKAGTNNGAHQIDEWTKIKKDDLLKKVKKWPIEQKGNLSSVIIDNKEILVSHSHAKKLLKASIATKPPKRALVVDDSEIL